MLSVESTTQVTASETSCWPISSYLQTPESIANAVSLGVVQPSDIISNISNPLYAQAFQVLLADATSEQSHNTILSDFSTDDVQSAAIVAPTGQEDHSQQINPSVDSMMVDNEVSTDSILDPTLFSSSDSDKEVSFDRSFNDGSFSDSSFILSMYDSRFMYDDPPAPNWSEFNFEMRLSGHKEPKFAKEPLTFDPKVMNCGGKATMGDISPLSVVSPTPSPCGLQSASSSSANSQRGLHGSSPSPQCNERLKKIPGGKGKKKLQTSHLHSPPNTPKKRKASTQPESPARAQARYEANLAKIAQNRRELLDAGQLKLSDMPIATPGDVILPPRDYRLWDRRFKTESGHYRGEACFRASSAATLIPIDFEVVEVLVDETAKKHPELDKDTNISFENPSYKDTIPKLERLDLNKYRNLPLFTSLGQQVFVKPAEYDRAMARKTFADVLRAHITLTC